MEQSQLNRIANFIWGIADDVLRDLYVRGKKNCELSEDDIRKISHTFLAFAETEQSKLFPNAAFGHWKVTVERPLRLRVDLGEAARAAFRTAGAEAGEAPLAALIDTAAAKLGSGPHTDFNLFLATLEALADTARLKLNAKRLKLVRESLAERDEAAEPILKKVHKPGKAEADPLRGLYEATGQGKRCMVEYEPDTDLRDTEQVPLQEAGGIEAFIRREVLPHAPDAWIDEASVKTGYEISFTRYFYKPPPLRTLEEIRADILALQKETEGLLEEIIGTGDRRMDGTGNGASTAPSTHLEGELDGKRPVSPVEGA